jgi:nicotinate phosphoribosyltransferase
MSSPWVHDSNAALLTDFYELTMLQSYFNEGMDGLAVFDLFVRRLPPNRNYLIACGLDHVLHYLENFAFSPEAIQYLKSLDRFSEQFIASLENFRFAGDVYAMPEGTIVFPNEPVLEVVASLPQAQIVETFVMNQVQVAMTAASKASRIVHAARGRSVVDFGLRRMQGADAGLKAPRAFYIAGVNSTSSVIAGQIFGVPVAGTMGHSYIQSFETELDAFRSFLRAFPTAILLIDTYDTLRGAQRVVDLAREIGTDFRASGVRLDSGDLLGLSRQVRKILDGGGLTDLKIFASSNLDEYVIENLIASGAPFDGFGVGAHMAISSDAPVMDTAYKLVEYAGRPKMKLSQSKDTLPGPKQVFRQKSGDILALAGESMSGEPLLAKVMENGRRLHASEPIEAARTRCRTELAALPSELMSLSTTPTPYRVDLSPRLAELRAEIAKSR